MARHENGRADKPYFFLSYARTPRLDENDHSDPDMWVHKLHQDLCKNILGMTALRPGSVGFIDRNNRSGVRWPGELAEALATCRVFVPLYSPRYFESKDCGMEWFAFARRQVNSRDQGRASVDAIVPALWSPVRAEILPDVAQDIQYEDPSFGPRYATHGFFGLIKLTRYREDYEVAVYELARRIVNVAQRTQVAPEPPSVYASLENAFARGRSDRQARRHLRITVLALDHSTLPDGRARDYYGESPRLWNPYHPASRQPLADYAADLTTCIGCQPTIGTFEEHAAQWVNSDRPIPGLCLIDPWATASAACTDKFQRLDGLKPSWVSVLVPWNNQDPELSAAEQALRKSLGLSLNRKLASVPQRCRMAADGIPTLREFSEILPQMTRIMLKRFRKDKHTPAHPPGGSHVERPRLRRVDPADSGEHDG
jgi:FxsC-like protein